MDRRLIKRPSDDVRGPGTDPRYEFEEFGQALLTVLRVLRGDWYGATVNMLPPELDFSTLLLLGVLVSTFGLGTLLPALLVQLFASGYNAVDAAKPAAALIDKRTYPLPPSPPPSPPVEVDLRDAEADAILPEAMRPEVSLLVASSPLLGTGALWTHLTTCARSRLRSW
eukprot:6067683-Prymnesium_polylepis.1